MRPMHMCMYSQCMCESKHIKCVKLLFIHGYIHGQNQCDVLFAIAKSALSPWFILWWSFIDVIIISLECNNTDIV